MGLRAEIAKEAFREALRDPSRFGRQWLEDGGKKCSLFPDPLELDRPRRESASSVKDRLIARLNPMIGDEEET